MGAVTICNKFDLKKAGKKNKNERKIAIMIIKGIKVIEIYIMF